MKIEWKVLGLIFSHLTSSRGTLARHPYILKKLKFGSFIIHMGSGLTSYGGTLLRIQQANKIASLLHVVKKPQTQKYGIHHSFKSSVFAFEYLILLGSNGCTNLIYDTIFLTKGYHIINLTFSTPTKSKSLDFSLQLVFHSAGKNLSDPNIRICPTLKKSEYEQNFSFGF